jgi:hypothetical protein
LLSNLFSGATPNPFSLRKVPSNPPPGDTIDPLSLWERARVRAAAPFNDKAANKAFLLRA